MIVIKDGKKMYHYKECGLDNVFLLNGFKEHETEYGKGISFTCIEGLHKAISLHIIRRDNKLSGKDFRFLRKELELTQQQLAKYLGIKPLEINRWELEKTAGINPLADRLLRLLYLEKTLGNPHVLELLETLQELPDNPRPIKLKLKKDDGWQNAA